MSAPVPPPLRMGILGAATIAPIALVRPAREVDDVDVVSVAARDPEKARRFAARHGIGKVHSSYAEMLDDPSLDAIYVPLPNGLHAEWTLRALEAGKHVLCEKPLASNADEAARMAEAAEKSGRRLMEAFHWRYHPLSARVLEILASGELGTVRHVEARLCVPMLKPGDIRFRWDLAGGALMDTGCYTVNIVRTLAGAGEADAGDPEVLSARAWKLSPDVDRAMEAGLRFPNGVTARIQCSLLSGWLLSAGAQVRGDQGRLSVFNPVAPQIHHRLKVRSPRGTRVERVRGDASYTAQLRAFASWLRGGPEPPSDARDGVRNMAIIDAIYEAAGMRRRGT
ncbi:MAG: Gfo/Idh/MocA family protein [Myxococcota bacterium]